MENASKALIIAGAILLAILLISLGIMVFTQARNTVNDSGMSQAEISFFNNQFVKYEKDSIKGSEIKSLIQEVNVNNSQDESKNHQIELIGAGTGTTVDGRTTYLTNSITNTKSYKVLITGYSTGGRVSQITIQ